MASLENFDELFRQHSEPLQQIAYGIVRSRETAAEIVQDVFLKLWSAREVLEVEKDARHYLARATRNRALDCAAREARHRRWEEERHDIDDLPHGTVRSHAMDDVQAREESHDTLAHAVAVALAAMPERRRQVCELRWVENRRPAEISMRLGIAVKTVETQIARGLKDLRECMRVTNRYAR